MQVAQKDSSWRIYSLLAAIALLVILSFLSLDLQLSRLLSERSWELMSRFLGELLSPHLEQSFLSKVGIAALETMAMSALGTLIAACLGIGLALVASKKYKTGPARARAVARIILNALRSIPELVWAALLLISVGLGPFAGTLALALHTTGVLGRLFAESIENAPPHTAETLRV